MRPKKLRVKKIWRFAFYIFIFVSFFIFCESRIEILPKEYLVQSAQNYVDEKVTEIINEEIENFNNTYNITKSDDNKLSIMEVDTNTILDFQIKLSQEINKKINGGKYTFVPIGSLLNVNLLNSIGISVPVKMNFIGSAEVKIDTQLLSSGINQSVYKMVAVVDASVVNVSLKNNLSVNISSQYPLCELYIAGEVPNYRVR